jgi:hypothetical protein
VHAVRRVRHPLADLPQPPPARGVPPQPGPRPPVPVRPASRHLREVRLMDAVIALLGAACIIVSGALAWLWLIGRAEQRAEHRRERARAAAPRLRAGLITGSQAASPRGGPDHPDWPLPPRRQGLPPRDLLHSALVPVTRWPLALSRAGVACQSLPARPERSRQARRQGWRPGRAVGAGGSLSSVNPAMSACGERAGPSPGRATPAPSSAAREHGTLRGSLLSAPCHHLPLIRTYG